MATNHYRSDCFSTSKLYGNEKMFADVVKMINDEKHMAIACVTVDVTMEQPYREMGVVFTSNADTITITVRRHQIYPCPVPIVTKGRTVALNAASLQLENA